ncbi:hypothetical protein RJ640_016859 [Escallonia rubra]|uniref:Protein TONSOKU n=1 Tax=Escallonia rubra TaxID=112253 RepID=A0AA88REX9_9ASTE|nr:hypothetical protein RJ640_016859 [Escallonia rubra]
MALSSVKDTDAKWLILLVWQDVSPVASNCDISAFTPYDLEESTCSHKSRSSKLAVQDANDIRSSSTNEAFKNFNFGAYGSRCDADDPENILCVFISPPLLRYKYHLSYYTYFVFDNMRTLMHALMRVLQQHLIFKIEDDFVHVDPCSCVVNGTLSIERMKVAVACLYYSQLPQDKRSKGRQLNSGLLPVIQHMKCGERALESLEVVDDLKDRFKQKDWAPKRLMKLYIDCCKELSEPPNLKLLEKLYILEVSEDEVTVSDCELQDVSVAPLFNALHMHKPVALLNLSHNLLGNETMEKLQQVFISSSQKYGGLVLDLHCNRFGPTALFQICECPVLFTRLEVLNISGNRLTDACASYLSTILQNCKALYSLNIERCSITSRTIQKIADSLDSGSVLAQLCLGALAVTAVLLNDGALQLLESLSNETQELVKLDLSSCGLTSQYIVRLNAENSVINGILELNLGGNPIMQEILQALAVNTSLEVLNLAENINPNENSTLHHGFARVKERSNSLQADLNLFESSLKASAYEEVETAQQELCAVNRDSNQLEVADSEDDEDGEKPSISGFDGSCMGSSKKSPNLWSQFIQELSGAISTAKQLQLEFRVIAFVCGG